MEQKCGNFGPAPLLTQEPLKTEGSLYGVRAAVPQVICQLADAWMNATNGKGWDHPINRASDSSWECVGLFQPARYDQWSYRQTNQYDRKVPSPEEGEVR